MNDRSKTALPVSARRYRHSYVGIVPEGTMVLPRELRGPRFTASFRATSRSGASAAMFSRALRLLRFYFGFRPFARRRSAFDGGRNGPRAGQEFLQPERADDRLHVAELAAADPLRYLGHRRGKGLDELALVELLLARRQAAREVDVDKLGRVGNDRMDARKVNIFARRIACFLFELALRAGELVLVRIELAGRIFDHHLAGRVTILPLQQHT